jgi:predicted AlkP superfamily phosphohydrolase/phosphomutase
LLDINRKTFELLLEKSPKVLTFVISASDFAQHYMWQYIDSSHPLYQEEKADEFRPLFAEIWKRIDDILGTALDTMPTDSIVMIVSDHGFGKHLGSFYLNSWLYENRYLFKPNQITSLNLLRQLRSGFIKRLPPSLVVKLRRALRRDNRPDTRRLFDIDMQRSLAFSPSSSNISGQICLNRQASDFRHGHLDYLQVKEEIVEKLKSSCKDHGLRVDVTYPHEVYSGEYMNMSPDSIISINNYEYSIKASFDGEIFRKPPINLSHTGSHRKEGVFMAYGKAIKENMKPKGITIYDIAPTILHIMDLPIPKDMDGRVISEIFTEDSEPACRQVRFVKPDIKQEVRERVQKLKASGTIV